MSYWLILDSNQRVDRYETARDGEPYMEAGETRLDYYGDPDQVLGRIYDGEVFLPPTAEASLAHRWGSLENMRKVYLGFTASATGRARGYVDAEQKDLYKEKYQEALQVDASSTADPAVFPRLAPEVGIKHPTIQLLAAACIQNWNDQEALKASSEITRVTCQAQINAATTFLGIHEAFTTHFPNEEI